MTNLQQLRLFQLSSSFLPVGGFTYSQGLEWAVEAGLVKNIDDFLQWQINYIEYCLIIQEIPLLERLYKSVFDNNFKKFRYWLEYLLACRSTSELRSEEIKCGEAMVHILYKLNILPSTSWLMLLKRSKMASLAWLGYQWNIPIDKLILSLAWSNLEHMIMIGVKLIPFGHTTAQLVLLQLTNILTAKLAIRSHIADDDLGGSIPIATIASSCHETQYTRLFRS